MRKNKHIGIIGAGSFGTALAVALSSAKKKVRLWDRKPYHLKSIAETRLNSAYLPEVILPDNLGFEDDLKKLYIWADYIIFAIPTQRYREVLESLIRQVGKSKFNSTKDEKILINLAKGIERGSLRRLSEITKEVAGSVNYVSLSGPSHAEEIGRLMPTTIVAASENIELASEVQDTLKSSVLRVYTSDDLLGVELGGALKNIIALGAGISDGIGFGDNAKAGLIIRGQMEISRLGVAMGAKKETFGGLTGVGDLIVTCTSPHSRNRRCGIMIGQGTAPEIAVKKIGMVVEGVESVKAAVMLAKKYQVEMPITECIYKCLEGELKPQKAVSMLMNLPASREFDVHEGVIILPDVKGIKKTVKGVFGAFFRRKK